MERYQENLILCSKCKRNLPRESFAEYNLRKHYHCCRECFRKEMREQYRNSGRYKGTTIGRSEEEIEKERREKAFLSDPYEQINKTIERLVKERGEYKQKENEVSGELSSPLCGYCGSYASVGFNGKDYCWKHFLIEVLSMGKPLPLNTPSNSTELARKLGILEELEELGVNID